MLKLLVPGKGDPKGLLMLMKQKICLGLSCFLLVIAVEHQHLLQQLRKALVQDAVKTKNLGFCRILFMCCSDRLVQVCNQTCNPSWEDKTLLHDLVNLQHQGVCCKALFVPRAVLGCVCKYAC